MGVGLDVLNAPTYLFVGTLRIMEKCVQPQNVTIRDIAQKLNLSLTTVSDVLNRGQAHRYSPKTVQKIRQAMEEMGYIPMGTAQELARTRSRRVGVVINRTLMNPYFSRILIALERQLAEEEMRMELLLERETQDSLRESIRRLLADNVGGLILGPVYEPLDLAGIQDLLENRQLPVVLFGGVFESRFDIVGVDHEQGIYSNLHYLLQRGHRRIVYLGLPPPRADYSLKPVLQKFARDFYDRLVWLGLVWNDYGSEYSAMFNLCRDFVQRWLTVPHEFRATAVCCANDQLALTLMRALAERGVEVPADLSVIGFDNLPESEYWHTPLTTQDVRVDEQMKAILKLFMRRYQDTGACRRTICIEPFLVERESVRSVEPDREPNHQPYSAQGVAVDEILS